MPVLFPFSPLMKYYQLVATLMTTYPVLGDIIISIKQLLASSDNKLIFGPCLERSAFGPKVKMSFCFRMGFFVDSWKVYGRFQRCSFLWAFR
jgi:hypothetical protein